ncbi:hypothetical protein DICVIV_02637 [Dictyocaulus viviparus]|uniref:Uncharacterized protein n=1 Tax=Dictyocaulus viviparus TaxID=29172 RepID=A0A0D8Y3B3_DICVI|nr:hypothetical protein DICVIV_02637 [Dictyocaulus viviparus]
MTSGDVLLHNYWRGCAEYAPLSWHENGNKSIMRLTDCVEVLMYIILDMTGFLIWRGLHKDLIRRHKEHLDIKALPPPLADYWCRVRRAHKFHSREFTRQNGYMLLNGLRGGATYSFLDFRALMKLMRALYTVFGDVVEQSPYDYEIWVEPYMWGADQAPCAELAIEKEQRRYRSLAVKANYESRMVRDEFIRRISAQTEWEQAATLSHSRATRASQHSDDDSS